MTKTPTYEDLARRLKQFEAGEAQFRHLIDTTMVGMFRTRIRDGRFLFANRALAEMIGFDSVDQLMAEYVTSENYTDPARRVELLARLREDGRVDDFEINMARPDGRYIEIAMSAVAYPDQGYLEGLIVDITGRKQAEWSLRESEKRYRNLVENAPDLLYRTDLQGVIAFISPSVFQLSGYTVDEAMGMKMAEEIYAFPEERAIFLEKLRKTGRIENFEARLKRKDGSLWWASTNAHVYKDSDGNVIGVEGITRDISDLKMAERALKESEARLKKAQAVARIGSWELDLVTGSLWGSEEAFSICGIERVSSFLPVEHYLGVVGDAKILDRVLRALVERNEKFDIEYQYRRQADGKVIWIHSVAERVLAKGVPVKVLGVIQDITEKKGVEAERKSLELRLQREEKMRSLGVMAGGIAHDLNNILSGIVSYPELLLMDLSADSPLRKPIETIKDSGQRAADVVSDLLTIARGVTTGREVLNLNTQIEEYLGSAEHLKLRQRHPGVSFKILLEPDPLNTACATTHIKKILMNLVANAAEAISGSGTVAISTANRYLDEPLCGYAEIRSGEYVLLRVSDDGTGIPAKSLERIFEPFYTKKILGKSGTGLGLAVVWNAVQDHDGYINVTSGAGGTTFDLYFQVSREEIVAEKNVMALSDYSGNGETVLVVDDEQRQRTIACRLLARLGYKPVAVHSGEAAVAYLKESAVDLVVLDMIMEPGIDGLETYRRILDLHPGQRAIITSGFSETERVKAAQQLGAGDYVKKPYLMETIGLAMKNALAS